MATTRRLSSATLRVDVTLAAEAAISPCPLPGESVRAGRMWAPGQPRRPDKAEDGTPVRRGPQPRLGRLSRTPEVESQQTIRIRIRSKTGLERQPVIWRR